MLFGIFFLGRPTLFTVRGPIYASIGNRWDSNMKLESRGSDRGSSSLKQINEFWIGETFQNQKFAASWKFVKSNTKIGNYMSKLEKVHHFNLKIKIKHPLKPLSCNSYSFLEVNYIWIPINLNSTMLASIPRFSQAIGLECNS